MRKHLKRLKRKILPGDAKLKTVYTGSIYDRMQGLENFFKEGEGASILDIGSAEALVSYEFARNGASLIHGFEGDPKRVAFSKMLFQEVPIKSEFRKTNLAISHLDFDSKFKDILLDEYDITLYLGVYHHLKKDMNENDLHDFIRYLLKKTKKYFVVRTDMIDLFEELILDNMFELFSEAPKTEVVGKLKIYKRKENK